LSQTSLTKETCCFLCRKIEKEHIANRLGKAYYKAAAACTKAAVCQATALVQAAALVQTASRQIKPL